MQSRNIFLIVILAVTTAVTSCAPQNRVSYTPAFRVPEQLGIGSDSVSIADVPWNVFYRDVHLRSLIDSTLSHNLDLHEAVQNIWIANALFQERRGALRPSVDGIASLTLDKFGRYTLEGKNNRGTNFNSDFFFGFRSSWEVDIWKKLRNRKRAAYLRMLASENGVRMLRTTLVAEVAKRYYDLVALDMKLAIIKRNIRLRESALDIISIQKEAGGVTQLAVEQFRAQLLSSKALQASILRDIRATENEINLLAGRGPQTILRTDSLPEIPLSRAISTGFAKGMAERRPDLKEAELQVLAGKADIDAARAEFYPSLVLSPFVGMNPFNIANIVNPASLAVGIMGGLAAPIFNRIQITAQYNRLSEQTKQDMISYQKRLLNAYYEVRNSLNDIEQLQQQYKYKHEEAEVLRNAVDISNDLYVAGYASYLEVIVAQRNIVDVELEAVTTRNELAKSYTNLYRSLGGGWR